MSKTQIQTTTGSSVVAQNPKTDIRSMLEGDRFKQVLLQGIAKHLSVERFTQVAMQQLRKNSKLAECEQTSFFSCLITLSQVGLEPDGRMAYLIPFENRRKGIVECQLIISYMGLFEMAMRTGKISNIHADKICENDDFGYDRGQILEHKINFKSPRGKAYAYYALCRFKDGSEKSEVMTLEEIKAIQARSKSGGSGPWITDFDEMAKKTVFRRLSKWLPLSTEIRDIEDAQDQPQSKEIKVHAPVFQKPVFVPTPALPAAEVSEVEVYEPEHDERLRDVEVVSNNETIPEFIADTPQKELSIALRDASISEADFMKFLRDNTILVGKAKMVSELSNESADEVLSDFSKVVETMREASK